MECGRDRLDGGWQPPRPKRSDVATLLFTSGTGGHPKGVELTHHNLLHQLQHLSFLPIHPADKAVSYLPPWHAYGRTLE